MKKIKHSIKMKKLKDNIRYYCFTHSAVSSHLYLKLLEISNFSMICKKGRFLILNTVESAPIWGCTLYKHGSGSGGVIGEERGAQAWVREGVRRGKGVSPALWEMRCCLLLLP